MSDFNTIESILVDSVAPVVPLPPAVIAGCAQHFELLIRWNERLNLTRITEPAEAAIRHYGQSLFLAAHVSPGAVVDVGTGPGFPGIPLALYRPDCTVTLVESDQRKAVFLREASRNLPNVVVQCSRAQAVGGRFDWLISRAVATNELLTLKIADRLALLLSDASATELGLWSTPLPWGDGVLASRSPLARYRFT